MLQVRGNNLYFAQMVWWDCALSQLPREYIDFAFKLQMC